jgi:hypothetical protein
MRAGHVNRSFFSAWTIDFHFTCHTAYSARVTRNYIYEKNCESKKYDKVSGLTILFRFVSYRPSHPLFFQYNRIF